MYADLRAGSFARVIVQYLGIFDMDIEAAVREAFDPRYLDAGIIFEESYLDDLAIACNELWPSIPPSEWIRVLYKVNEERKSSAPAIAAEKGIPKWPIAVAVVLGGLLLLSRKKK